jgi:circadian clock protein KaiC
MFDISGYAQGSVTAVTGRSGSGKTTLALHFVARASAQEKALFFGFYESPELLVRMGEVLGLALAPQVAAGDLRFVVKPFGENLLDALAAELLEEVARTGARRVVIDGVGGFTATPAYAERGGAFVATLTNELRRLGATTFLVVEENDRSGTRDVDTSAMSALGDALLQLTVKEEDVVRRFLSIRKTRLCRSDLRQRELVLTDTGVAVRDRSAAAAS